MKKLIIILMLSANFIYAQEEVEIEIEPYNNFTVTEFNVNVDTIIQTLPDIPCNQVDFIINANYEDTIYVGRVEDGYVKVDWIPEGGYGFVVTNANQVWFVGTRQTEEQVLTIRYWIIEEDSDEED